MSDEISTKPRSPGCVSVWAAPRRACWNSPWWWRCSSSSGCSPGSMTSSSASCSTPSKARLKEVERGRGRGRGGWARKRTADEAVSECDLQHEDTGTLMASTIHTMSIRLRQMAVREEGGSTAWPELLLAPQGSWVVGGTCLFRKLPLAVDDGPQLLPGKSASPPELLDTSPPTAVTFHSPSVPLPWTPWNPPVAASFGVEKLLKTVAFGVPRPDSVGGDEDSGELASCRSVRSSLVGGSSCTSLEVMACCALFCPRSLTLKPQAVSADWGKLSGFSTLRWLREEGSSKPISWASAGGTGGSTPLSDPEAARSRFPLLVDSTIFGRAVAADVLTSFMTTVARLWTRGTFPWTEVWGPGSRARGWRAAVGRMMSEDRSCPLGNHSQLLEPSWCQSFGGGLGFWVAAMETGCCDASPADVTGADSASRARAPAEKEKVDDDEAEEFRFTRVHLHNKVS